MIGRINTKSKSKEVINAIINDYLVSSNGNINEGDFIEFIKDFPSSMICDDIDYVYGSYIISAVALTNNRVFIAYAGSSYKLYGIVCTIDGTTITTGTETLLSSTSAVGHCISTLLLSDDKVFIAYGPLSTGSSNSTNFMICTVNETTITKGGQASLTSNYDTPRIILPTKLADNKVFVVYSCKKSSSSKNNQLCACVFTIDGTTITKGTETVIYTEERVATSNAISVTALTNNEVFLTYTAVWTGETIYGAICTIDNTTITLGEATLLVNESLLYRTKTVKISNNKVAIFYFVNEEGQKSLICSIDSLSITVGDSINLNIENISESAGTIIMLGNVSAIIPLSNNRFYMIRYLRETLNGVSKDYLIGTILIIDDSNMTMAKIVKIGEMIFNETSSVLLTDGRVFIAEFKKYSQGSSTMKSIYGILKTTVDRKYDYIKKYITGGEINGVAKTSGINGEEIEIYEPGDLYNT